MKAIIFFSFLLSGLTSLAQDSNTFTFTLNNCASDSMWVICQGLPGKSNQRQSFKINANEKYTIEIDTAGTVIQFMDENFSQRKLFIFEACSVFGGGYGFTVDMKLKDSFLVYWEGLECTYDYFSEEETKEKLGI